MGRGDRLSSDQSSEKTTTEPVGSGDSWRWGQGGRTVLVSFSSRSRPFARRFGAQTTARPPQGPNKRVLTQNGHEQFSSVQQLQLDPQRSLSLLFMPLSVSREYSYYAWVPYANTGRKKVDDRRIGVYTAVHKRPEMRRCRSNRWSGETRFSGQKKGPEGSRFMQLGFSSRRAIFGRFGPTSPGGQRHQEQDECSRSKARLAIDTIAVLINPISIAVRRPRVDIRVHVVAVTAWTLRDDALGVGSRAAPLVLVRDIAVAVGIEVFFLLSMSRCRRRVRRARQVDGWVAIVAVHFVRPCVTVFIDPVIDGDVTGVPVGHGIGRTQARPQEQETESAKT